MWVNRLGCFRRFRIRFWIIIVFTVYALVEFIVRGRWLGSFCGNMIWFKFFVGSGACFCIVVDFFVDVFA